MPTPKAPAPLLMASRKMDEASKLNVTAFFKKIKSNHLKLAAKERRAVTLSVRGAFEFYLSIHQQTEAAQLAGRKASLDDRSFLTRTEQLNAFDKISKAAISLRVAISDNNALHEQIRNLDTAYTSLDRNSKLLLHKVLGFSDGDFHQMRTDIRLGTINSSNHETHGLLNSLANMPEVPPDTGSRFANPGLALLIQQLGPLWEKATGYSVKRVGGTRNISQAEFSTPDTLKEQKDYYFAEAIIEIMRKNKIKPIPSNDQVNKLCVRLFPQLSKK